MPQPRGFAGHRRHHQEQLGPGVLVLRHLKKYMRAHATHTHTHTHIHTLAYTFPQTPEARILQHPTSKLTQCTRRTPSAEEEEEEEGLLKANAVN